MSEISSIYFGKKAVQSIETKNGILYGGVDPFEYEAVDGGYAVTGFKQELVRKRKWPKTITIPETYEDLPVVEIGQEAFSHKQLRKVTIPKTIKRLQESCFHECEATIILSKDCDFEFIGNCCFYGCYGTEVLKVNGIIQGNLNYFYDLVSIEGNYSFQGGYNYFSITGDSKLVSINLKNVERIIGSAFDSCSSLTSVVIPDSVIEFNSWNAFNGCTSLTTVVIGNNITNIQNSCFSRCSSLVNVILGNSITTIEDWAFYQCTSLTNIELPNSVAEIGTQAFRGCSSLTNVTIGSGITKMKELCFGDCPLLNDCYYNGTIVDWSRISFKRDDANPMYFISNFYILDENGNIEHNNRHYSLLTNLIIPNEVVSIGQYAFNNFSLTSVEFGSNVSHIGKSAFFSRTIQNFYYNGTIAEWCNIVLENIDSTPARNNVNFCILDENGAIEHNNKHYSLLTDLIIPDEVTRIGDCVFAGVQSLTSVIISNNVTSIGTYAFLLCTALKTVEIPNSVASMGEYVFNGCSSLQYNSYDNANYLGNENNPYLWLITNKNRSLTSCQINENCKHIFSQAFKGCYLLASVVIPDGVISIGDRAFSQCDKLTSIIIPDSVVSLEEYCFSSCEALVNVVIGNMVSKIPTATFSNCTSLTNITIPNSVTSIGLLAFNRNSSLASITIGTGVTTIERQAFENCTSLTDITYEGTKAQWKNITLGSNWKRGVPATVVHCTDGDITL